MKLMLLGLSLVAGVSFAETTTGTTTATAVVNAIKNGNATVFASKTGLSPAVASGLVQSAGFKAFAASFKTLSAAEQTAIAENLAVAAKNANVDAQALAVEVSKISNARSLVNADFSKLTAGQSLASYIAATTEVAKETGNAGILTSLSGEQAVGLEGTANYLAQAVTLLTNQKQAIVAKAAETAVANKDYATVAEATTAIGNDFEEAITAISNLNKQVESGSKATPANVALVSQLNKDLGLALTKAASTIASGANANEATLNATVIIAEAYAKNWVNNPRGQAFNLALILGKMVGPQVQPRLLAGAASWYVVPLNVLSTRHKPVLECGSGVAEDYTKAIVN